MSKTKDMKRKKYTPLFLTVLFECYNNLLAF
jgi:hypothetical protein